MWVLYSYLYPYIFTTLDPDFCFSLFNSEMAVCTSGSIFWLLFFSRGGLSKETQLPSLDPDMVAYGACSDLTLELSRTVHLWTTCRSQPNFWSSTTFYSGCTYNYNYHFHSVQSPKAFQWPGWNLNLDVFWEVQLSVHWITLTFKAIQEKSVQLQKLHL